MSHAENQVNYNISFADLCQAVHEYSLSKEFWPYASSVGANEISSWTWTQRTQKLNCRKYDYAKRNLGEALMLVNTELAEALEGFRKGVPIDHPEEGAGVEVADAIIRLMDIGYGMMGPAFARMLIDKQAHNLTRPSKHGKNF